MREVRTTRLRIALTMPGAVSLGAFEAGAVAALLRAVQHAQERDPRAIGIDVITGASSGGLTGVLAAHALLAGHDPAPPLHRAWVREPSLRALRGRGLRAPLSLDRARAVARELLAAGGPGRAVGPGAVRLEMALSSLRGFAYEIARVGRRPLPATSYLDWASFTLTAADVGAPGSVGAPWAAAVDAAVASASHPAAFPATELDREDVRAEYLRSEVGNLPRDGRLALWYSDGGLLENEPLGRCLDVVREVDAGTPAPGRLVLLVRPEPGTPPGPDDPAWSGRGPRPRWTETLVRALQVVLTQSVFEDLRRVEKTNTRLEWTADLAATLAELVPDEPLTRERLASLLARVEEDKRLLGRHRERGSGEDEPLAELLFRAVQTAAGLEGKLPVAVEVVTPRAPAMGDALLQFGGFLDERVREGDFALGYASMLAWMEDPDRGLTAHGLEPELARAAIGTAREGTGRWPELRGRRGPVRGAARRTQLALLAVRGALVGLLDAVVLGRRRRALNRARARRRRPS